MDKSENGNIDVHEGSLMENGGFELRDYSQLGGTENDERDMQMLGRTQQLNVRRSPDSFRIFVSLTIITAQFQVHLNSRLCLHLDEHLGNCFDVRFSLLYAQFRILTHQKDQSFCSYQWWYGRNDLGLSYCLDWLHVGFCDSGRNGVDVSTT